MLLTNLTTGVVYIIEVQGATLSLYEPDKWFKGSPSHPHRVHLRPNCVHHVKAFTVLEAESDSSKSSPTKADGGLLHLGAGVVAGAIVVAVILAAVLIAIILMKK